MSEPHGQGIFVSSLECCTKIWRSRKGHAEVWEVCDVYLVSSSTGAHFLWWNQLSVRNLNENEHKKIASSILSVIQHYEVCTLQKIPLSALIFCTWVPFCWVIFVLVNMWHAPREYMMMPFFRLISCKDNNSYIILMNFPRWFAINMNI